MRALEESQAWFTHHLLPAVEREVPQALGVTAFGVAGRGSECFGFDDEISRDHDSCNTVTMWLTDEDERKFGFQLTRVYNRLCKECGITLQSTPQSRLGDSERGVVIIGDFLARHLGYSHAPQSWQEWLYTPEYAIAETVNGRIFRDDPGVFTAIRQHIRHGMPEDVRIKKLASRAVMMAQSGQYNYSRCLKHHEKAASEMALRDFVQNTVSMVFLLNFSFAPYYKWMFRAMRELPVLGNIADEIDELFAAQDKEPVIENICFQVISELRNQGLTELDATYLEPHAFELMKKIRSREIKSLHVMEG